MFVVAVVALNVSAARDYIQLGRKQGDPIGSTGRYAHAHQNVPGQKFYVVSSETQPYYVWGNLGPGNDRLARFTKANLVQSPIDPTTLKDFRGVPPFALFMRRDVWQPLAPRLAELLSARPDSQRDARRRASRPGRPFLEARPGG